MGKESPRARGTPSHVEMSLELSDKIPRVNDEVVVVSSKKGDKRTFLSVIRGQGEWWIIYQEM